MVGAEKGLFCTNRSMGPCRAVKYAYELCVVDSHKRWWMRCSTVLPLQTSHNEVPLVEALGFVYTELAVEQRKLSPTNSCASGMRLWQSTVEW